MVNKEKWIKLAIELYKIQKQRKELELKEKPLTDQLKSLSNYKTTQMGGFLYLKTRRRGSVDYGLIPELQGINLDLYRKSPIDNYRLIKI